MKSPAPVFVDAFALSEWLLGRLGDDGRVLPRAICAASLRLLDAVTLAVHGRDTPARVEEADERLIALRVQIRLAERTGVFTEAQALHALEIADRVGRQVGGWLRSLGGL